MDDPEQFSPGSEERNPGQKRKGDGGGQQPRAKRNRYISIACNECKRRKIKCNGKTPCERCGNLNLECVYAPNCCNNFKDTEDFKRMQNHIDTLQQQVNTLFTNLTSLRDSVETSFNTLASNPVFNQPVDSRPFPLSGFQSPSPNPRAAPTQSVRMPSAGPHLAATSASLQTPAPGASDPPADDAAIAPDAAPARASSSTVRDPLWLLTWDDAARLVRAWQDEVGAMYPIVDGARLAQHAHNVYQFMEATVKSGLSMAHAPDTPLDPDTRLLKVVLATGLLVERGGQIGVARQLYESVAGYVEELLTSAASLHGVRVLTAAAIYHFYRDDETIAWRLLGVAARLCFELGLHRGETFHKQMKTNTERAASTRILWSVYVLDKQRSFGAGLPFAMQDFDIDPRILQPDGPPYLLAMIDYSGIASKVCQTVARWNRPKATLNERELQYLDYELLEWHSTLPDSLQYLPPTLVSQGDRPNRVNRRFRIALLLHRNHMRIILHQPALSGLAVLKENRRLADTVVDVAKETIRILTETNQKSDLYSDGKELFNHFLVAAVSVLLLAMYLAPKEYVAQVREDFNLAIDLVRRFPPTSSVSNRLCKVLASIKEAAPKLGLTLNPRTDASTHSSDPHSDAAVAMAGLAGHTMMFPTTPGMGSQSVTDVAIGNATGTGMLDDGPALMAMDLTDLLEAAERQASRFQNGEVSPSGQTPNEPGHQTGNSERGGLLFGPHEDDLSRILRDLF